MKVRLGVATKELYSNSQGLCCEAQARRRDRETVVPWTEILSVSDRISATIRSIEAAQKSYIALYDKYADGKLERELFLNKKKKYNADMEQMEEELASLWQAQEEERTEQEGSQRKADQAMAFLKE